MPLSLQRHGLRGLSNSVWIDVMYCLAVASPTLIGVFCENVPFSEKVALGVVDAAAMLVSQKRMEPAEVLVTYTLVIVLISI